MKKGSGRKNRPDTALSRQSEDPAWTALDAKVGGRDGLLKAAMASDSAKATILAELLLDPAFKSAGTKALAKKAGLTMPEVVDLFRNFKWVEATIALHENLPDIMKGAAEDAKPKMAPCADCKGSGKIEAAVCWVCGGSGRVRQAGDHNKLKFVGEATGFTGKQGPAIQNNIQVNAPSSMGVSFDDLMRKATVQIQRPKLEGVVDVDPISES
jgi:hypothetical protein